LGSFGRFFVISAKAGIEECGLKASNVASLAWRGARRRTAAQIPARALSAGDAQMIDLKGGYLVPGLWDVHIHPDYLSLRSEASTAMRTPPSGTPL
jgi:hypothetical protein